MLKKQTECGIFPSKIKRLKFQTLGLPFLPTSDGYTNKTTDAFLEWFLDRHALGIP